ncbi:hypothetical protein PRZ48_008923 [Zasmidium cellare]|uniref:F-box domain-containing protein n=1 Tax=Zasmidium cellare TaxID=395010 RepID=A0ABR0EHR2_ZASCE|nr:hypothetical protein PRZ48_008923 [Zasmidium cellare]
MAHMLGLPAELNTRIFSFLDDRRDVARCRLVCWTFHKLSSPFLITRVVFALRLDTIAKLREVVNHPYFSKYVDTLFYDASRYMSDSAHDWYRYVGECQMSPRNLVDEEWMRRERENREVIGKLAALQLDDSFPAYDPDLRLSHPRDNSHHHQMGCPKSFSEYYIRYKNQVLLEDNGIGHHVLREVFLRLPKLRHIEVGDYRCLARSGESYDSMCQRLFGLVLEPTSPLEGFSVYFDDLFEATAELGLQLHSVGTVRHPFTSTKAILEDDAESLNYPRTYRKIGRLLSLLKPGPYSLGASLRELEVVFEDSSVALEDLGEALSNTGALEKLSVTILKYRKESDPGHITAYTEQPVPQDLLGAYLPCLKYLELRHLQLSSTQPLQDFLERHADTLRELRLIECAMMDRAGEQEKLAEWAGQNLYLTGVEVLTASDLTFLLMLQAWRIERGALKEDEESARKSGWERIRAREAKYLGGRQNTLGRTVDIADESISPEELRMQWWQRPCRM